MKQSEPSHNYLQKHNILKLKRVLNMISLCALCFTRENPAVPGSHAITFSLPRLWDPVCPAAVSTQPPPLHNFGTDVSLLTRTCTRTGLGRGTGRQYEIEGKMKNSGQSSPESAEQHFGSLGGFQKHHVHGLERSLPSRRPNRLQWELQGIDPLLSGLQFPSSSSLFNYTDLK